MAKVLVVVAHADDETLGAGGTLLRHKALGDEVHWCIVTAPFEPLFGKGYLATWGNQVDRVASLLGVKKVHRLALPTTELLEQPFGKVVEGVAGVMQEVQPDTVYTVNNGDVHTDHRVVFDAVVAASKPFRSSTTRLLCFECLSSTHQADPVRNAIFSPNVFVDITPFIDAKLQAMAAYATEIHPEPSPRSLEAVRSLARFRGCTVNVAYAEAFMLLREIQRVPPVSAT